MGDVIDLEAVRAQRLTDAWDGFTRAKARADETLKLNDMRAAVLAFEAFLDLAEPGDKDRRGIWS